MYSFMPLKIETFSNISPRSHPKRYGRWNYTALEADCPELLRNIHQLLFSTDFYSLPRKTLVPLTLINSKRHPRLNDGSFDQIQKKDVASNSKIFLRKSVADQRRSDYYKQISSQFTSRTITSRSKQGVVMQELKKRYALPNSGYSSRVVPSQSMNANGTNSLPCESFQSSDHVDHPKSSPPSVSQTNEPSGSFDQMIAKHSISSPPPPKNYEVERPDSGRCLSTPRYSTCLDTCTFSQCLPKTKATLSLQNVKLHKYRSLGQISNECLAPTVSNHKPLYRKEMLPYISEYWAYRPPDSFRPSKDRTLPDWDPDEEYQALLDFTYPLRPGHYTSKDSLDGDDLSSDSCLKDSGIVADSSLPSLSNTLTSKSMLSFPAYQSSPSNTANPAWDYSSHRGYVDPPHRSSRPLHIYNQPSSLSSHSTYKARPSVEHSTNNKAQLSESLSNSAITFGCSLATTVADSSFLSKSSNEGFSNHVISGRDSTGFIPTTQILPLNKEWESDEEYLALPYKLNELEALAQQLENLSVHLDNKSTCATNANKGIVKPTKDTTIQGGRTEDTLIDHGSGAEVTQSTCQLESDPIYTPKGLGCEDTIMELKKINNFIKKLGRWPGSRLMSNQQLQHGTKEQKNDDGLLAHIQNFSTKLEEMVQWLYEVAETMDNWISPQPEMESIKSSLDVCMAFKNDVNEHRELTKSVLKSGEILLQSVTDITPVLKETLTLIARQSKQLNGHAAHLYSSVLAAMNIVKDDLETKQNELEAAGLGRQSSLTEDGKWL
uniref:centrosomal protein of 68 kDa isoform X2 n=1 Tax=Pristiophorus japonicus TaxID=55135 RepID=UPI00398EF7CC